MSGTKSNDLEGLNVQEKAAVQAFIHRIQQVYGDKIQEIILFGSKAREDSQPDSDIDILVIVAEESWALRDDMSLIAAQESLAHDVLLGPRVIGKERWTQMARDQFTLYQNVAREGLVLMERDSSRED